MPILFPAQLSRRGVRVFIHPARTTDAPLAGVLPAGGETERPISIPRPPSGGLITSLNAVAIYGRVS